MSRTQVRNQRYTLAFGVDHTPMGPFLQIWDALFKDDYDSPLVDIDSMFGVRIKSQENLDANPRLAELVSTISQMYKDFKKQQGVYPNLSTEAVLMVAGVLGLRGPALERQVYELWD